MHRLHILGDLGQASFVSSGNELHAIPTAWKRINAYFKKTSTADIYQHIEVRTILRAGDDARSPKTSPLTP